MIEVLFLLIIAGILGWLIGVSIIFHHIKRNYNLYKVPEVAGKNLEDFCLIVKKLKVIRPTVQCTICNETLPISGAHSHQTCKCGNVFVESSPTQMIIGAKDISKMEDLSIVSVDSLVINNK